MDYNYSKYPSVADCKKIWKIGADSILRDSSDAPVRIRTYAKSQVVVIHCGRCLCPGVIAWIIRHGEFPRRRIFALNADKKDLRVNNWKEEDMETPNPLDVEVLRSVISYDPKTGGFKWSDRQPRNVNDRNWLNRYAGKSIKCEKKSAGYLYFKVFGISRKAHQWAWLYMYGYLPTSQESIDHKNRIKTDNRIQNLRIVSIRENNLNKPGFKPGNTPSQRIKGPYPSCSRIREVLVHDDKKGVFYWRSRPIIDGQDKRFNTLYANKRAGRYTGDHPVLIRIDGGRYLAQDLLWIFYNEVDPKESLVCLNGDQQDLRVRNWRLSTSPEKRFEMLPDEEKQKLLKERFFYDTEIGNFVHKERGGVRSGVRALNSRKAHQRAGYEQAGYWRVTVDGVDYQASHLVALYLIGVWLKNTDLVIDHINGNKLDNRAENLRIVDKSVNSRNRAFSPHNKSGFTGVIRDSQIDQKWRAFICVNGRRQTLGVFNTFEEAKKARVRACDDVKNTGIQIALDGDSEFRS